MIRKVAPCCFVPTDGRAGFCHRRSGLGLAPPTGLPWNFFFLTGNPECKSPEPVTTVRISWILRPGRQKSGVPAPSPQRGNETCSVMFPHGLGLWWKVGIPEGQAACPALSRWALFPPSPAICHQQLFLTGAQLSTADGDPCAPAGRLWHGATSHTRADVCAVPSPALARLCLWCLPRVAGGRRPLLNLGPWCLATSLQTQHACIIECSPAVSSLVCMMEAWLCSP